MLLTQEYRRGGIRPAARRLHHRLVSGTGGTIGARIDASDPNYMGLGRAVPFIRWLRTVSSMRDDFPVRNGRIGAVSSLSLTGPVSIYSKNVKWFCVCKFQ